MKVINPINEEKQKEVLLDISEDFKKEMGRLLFPELLDFFANKLHRCIIEETTREFMKKSLNPMAKNALFTLSKLRRYYSKNIPKGFVKIRGFSNYAIDREGYIMKVTNRRLNNVHVGKRGYRVASIINDSKENKHVTLHRLLALTFKYEKGCESLTIDHVDGNKLNNSLDNLEFVTITENLKRARDMGLYPIGEDWPYSVLTEEQVIDIYTNNSSNKEMSVKYKVEPVTISCIRSRRNWRKETEGLQKGDWKKENIKLTSEKARDIYTSTKPTRELAEKYGVSESTIRNIVRDVEWADVTENLVKGIKPYSPRKLAEEEVIDIYTSCLTDKEICDKYDSTLKIIRDIRGDKNYKKVTKGLIKCISKEKQTYILSVRKEE